jgi:hypothetical protein
MPFSQNTIGHGVAHFRHLNYFSHILFLMNSLNFSVI